MAPVVSCDELKNRMCRACGRMPGSSDMPRKICRTSSIERPLGTSNMICCRMALPRGR
jgi:hypothetical protein